MTAGIERPSCHFTTGPVGAACIAGRNAPLRELIDMALGTHAPLVNLVGPSKIGRSSFLRALRDHTRTNGAGTGFAWGSDQRVVAPLLDLGKRRGETSIRETVAREIAMEMTRHGLDVPSDTSLAGPAALDILATSMVNEPGTLFLLLVDRAEHFLVEDAALYTNEWTGGALQALGTLNDAMPQFGLVLSFGASGPVGTLDARARQDREEHFLVVVSELLNLIVDRLELGLVEDDAVVDFASRAAVQVPSQPPSPLTADEAEWLAELAGGHPFVLHRAGLLTWMTKVQTPAKRRTREQVQADVVDGLKPFIGQAIRRLQDRWGALEAAARLARGERKGSVRIAVAEALAGEGLASIIGSIDDDHVECEMRSPVIRAALLRALDGAAIESAARPTMSAATAPAPFSLSVERDGELHSMRVTPAEHDLLERLIAATPGTVVTPDELLGVLEAGSTRHQLTQRLSVLRRKLRDELHAVDADPIENIYDRGYTLREAHLYRLQGG